MKKLIIAAIIPALLTLGACAENIGVNHYDSDTVGTTSQAVPATVISVRPIKVSKNNPTGGTLVGSVAGGAVGSQIGRGNSAAVIGTVGGAILGGMAGALTQKGLSAQEGYEYVVRFDNGKLLTLVQGNDVLLAVGQRCLVLYAEEGDRARLIPYNGY